MKKIIGLFLFNIILIVCMIILPVRTKANVLQSSGSNQYETVVDASFTRGTLKSYAYTYTGIDGFPLRNSNTPTALRQIIINNDAPIITEDAAVDVTMSEDGSPTPFSLTLHAIDPDVSDILTWSVSTPASNGTASVSGTGTSIDISYTPTANYNGSDSFEVQVSDGNGGTDTITVNVTISSVNDAPICSDVTLITDEDTPGQTDPSCTDVDSINLTYSIVAQPLHGTASVVTGKLSYTPAANYNGADSFTYKANDGTLDSNTATVSVTVTAVNDAPVCSAVTLTTAEDTPGQTDPSCTDVDSVNLTYSVVAQPLHGTASVVTGKLSYTPAANYNGADSFTYKANDGTLDSNTATVSVTVTAVNDAPVCSAVTLTTAEDTSGQTDPSCTDVDSINLTYSIVAQPLHGTASVVTGKLSYTPAANYNGADSFTYKANDGTLDSNTATVSVTVTAVNDAPVCSAVTLTTAEDTPGQTDPSCTDVDSVNLTYAIVAQPLHGTASVVTGKLSYTPAANYNGADSFTYKANDGTLDSNTATVSVTVTAVNDAPVCSAVTLTTAEDTSGQTVPSCTDVDSINLTYSIVAQPLHGTASVVTGKLSYTPAANYNGADSFTYKANDGTLDSNTATVSVTVTAVNDAPVCSDVTLITREDTSSQTDPSCTDVDGNDLTYFIVSQSTHGSSSVVSGKLSYTPMASYKGADNFTYKANDGTLDSNIATVSVMVTNAPYIVSIDPSAVNAGSPDIVMVIFGANFGDTIDTRARLTGNGFDELRIPLQVLTNGMSIKIPANLLAEPNLFTLTIVKSIDHTVPTLPLPLYTQISNPFTFIVYEAHFYYLPIISH